MPAVTTLIEQALYAAITSDATLASLVGARVFDTHAGTPAAVGDYVVFMYLFGGDANSSPRRTVDITYRIEAISTTQSAAKAIWDGLDARLHNGALSVTGWSVIGMEFVRFVNRREIDQQITTFRKGGELRIRANTGG